MNIKLHLFALLFAGSLVGGMEMVGAANLSISLQNREHFSQPAQFRVVQEKKKNMKKTKRRKVRQEGIKCERKKNLGVKYACYTR